MAISTSYSGAFNCVLQPVLLTDISGCMKKIPPPVGEEMVAISLVTTSKAKVESELAHPFSLPLYWIRSSVLGRCSPAAAYPPLILV